MVAEDASLMGTTLVLTDKTELERLRQDSKSQQNSSMELVSELRTSLTAIAKSVQQLAGNADPQITRHVADGIAREAEQLDRTISGFLGNAKAATTNS